MELGDFGSILRQHKDEIDRVRTGNGFLPDILNCTGLLMVFRRAFEDGFQAWCVLELFVGIGILVSLKGGDRVVGT